MALTTDAEWFDRAAQALYQAAARTRNGQGLLVAPVGQDQCRALMRGALSSLFNASISISDEYELR